MSQLSFLSADFVDPEFDDLGGLLACHGQVTRLPGGCRLSILLDQRWRAEAVIAELELRSVPVEPVALTEQGEFLVRTELTGEVSSLASAWTRGAVKFVPTGLVPPPGFLRCWALAAGRTDDHGIVLGLDPRVPDSHDPLARAVSGLGFAPTVLGVRAGGPGLRVAGRSRRSRLLDLIGQLPREAGDWAGSGDPAPRST